MTRAAIQPPRSVGGRVGQVTGSEWFATSANWEMAVNASGPVHAICAPVTSRNVLGMTGIGMSFCLTVGWRRWPLSARQ